MVCVCVNNNSCNAVHQLLLKEVEKMREFKFRAWDTERKVMAEVISGVGDEEVTLQDGECWQWNTVAHYIAVIMQYTGLKDKNDTEIYEGDILSYESRIANKRILVVEWSQWDAMFNFGGIRVDYATKNSEVIGNVFEDGELINDCK